MKSFEGGQAIKPVSHTILRSVRQLGEFNGRQEHQRRQALHSEPPPQFLELLRHTAVLQSTESSNRIDSIITPLPRLRRIMARRIPPGNISEQEIAGYRDVLATVHHDYLKLPITPATVKKLHAGLFHYSTKSGGTYRFDDDVPTHHPDGTPYEESHFCPPRAIPDAMKRLHSHFNELWNIERLEPLILIAGYVFDLLQIYPFREGNGRISRLMTQLLLSRAGYHVTPYIALERIIEDTKHSYYDAISQSSQYWNQRQHDLEPWIEYFLEILITAYRELEAKPTTLSMARGTKTELVQQAIDTLPDRFRLTDLEHACPAVSRDMIRVVLNRLKTEGHVAAIGRGNGAWWNKIDTA